MENLGMKSEKLLLENESLDRKSERATEGFGELEDKSIEIIQSEKQEEKKLNRTSETCGTPSEIPTYALRISQRRRERKDRKILEEIKSKNSQI